MDRDKLMNETAAAVCLVNTTRSGNLKSQAQREMWAFLAMFHPDMPVEKRLELSRAAE